MKICVYRLLPRKDLKQELQRIADENNLQARTKIMEISTQLIDTIQNLLKPTLVGVSGYGGSGKSSFAKKLGEAIDAPVVGVDSFQKKGAFDTHYSL